MTFGEVDRKPLYLQVAEQIREAILRGDLAPGARLPTERELGDTFGVSRASVREALRSLQAHGLISGAGRIAPGRTVVTLGELDSLQEAVVRLLTLQRVPFADLVELRTTVEAAAVRRAADRAGGAAQERLAEARGTLGRMQARGVRIEDFHDADVAFHLALVGASGNQAMQLVMGAVRETVAAHLLDVLRSLGPRRQRQTLRTLTAEHAAILDAVESKDPDRAEALVRSHIVDFYASLAPQPPANGTG
jgi:GntR family transcriptional repressor for pyruvate dehydrogenase complex